MENLENLGFPKSQVNKLLHLRRHGRKATQIVASSRTRTQNSPSSTMKLTSLGCEKDLTQDSGLPCHLLELNQSCVLLECPLDLSALALFLPVFSPPHLATELKHTFDGTVDHCDGYKPSTIVEEVEAKAGDKRDRNPHRPEDPSSWSPSSTKRIRIDLPFQELNGQILVDAEPWYKTAELEFVDVGLLDAIIISNPAGMLGLPFLTRHPDCGAKVYATEATAEIGKLMMKELLCMHAEFVQTHGRSVAGHKPAWLNLTALPEKLRNSSYNRCLSSRGNWQSLYSAADVKYCLDHVQKLRYGEEVNVNGFLTISPSSSGLGIGTANWVIRGGRQHVGYMATSLYERNHSMPLDVAPLKGIHTLLFSDIECSNKPLKINAPENLQGATEHAQPIRPSSPGSGDSNGLTTATSGIFSGSLGHRSGVSSGSVGPLKSGAVALDTGGKGSSGDLHSNNNNNNNNNSNNVVRLDALPEVARACKATIDAIRKGGSVLVPLSPNGILLEYLDELSAQLSEANATNIPIYYISPAAEEMLAYGNIIPEWLCPALQEKLYSGDPSFGYVNLLLEGFLRHCKALHSADLQKVWQEPCVVLAAHWSLRMGPVLHLLHRWRLNPLCLLIMTEGKIDKELTLAPFMPLAMQVLEVSIPSRLRPKELVSLIYEVQPHTVLIPKALQLALEHMQNSNMRSTQLFYKKGLAVQVLNSKTEVEVDMLAELALEVQPTSVKPKSVAAASFRADLCLKDGRALLQKAPTISSNFASDHVLTNWHKYRCQWGTIPVDDLLKAFHDRGVFDIHIQQASSDDYLMCEELLDNDHERKAYVVEIRSPSQAWINVFPNSSHIKTNDPSLRSLVADALDSILVASQLL